MLRNQNGLSVYTVLSIILFAALIFILAIPNFYNLDKEQNVEDCINNMKEIWVATTDYLRDTNQDFQGDLEILRTTRKAKDRSSYYLAKANYCPETARQKIEYKVFGKYIADQIGDEVKHNFGVIVYCPNLSDFHTHFLPKIFYENMDPTQLQNYMIDDLDYIDKETGINGTRKQEMVEKYIEIWQTDEQAFAKRKADNTALRAMLFPEKFGFTN
ncbi:MAG: hypothetical protein RBR69_05570 [Candidatus Cloacimonadaceae bacterium]|nr:hypothetical protein [Candidatus Cloacimonadota bacterium]MDY0127580.1 hypothetical protein [Candidatus Cloacimonadaceae bacterium]MCB5255434.1 hypothetical protein [Candidatus Cloacimonadota bacterium]MCK9177889.1 hypothetical protein [Candidatus Cloacimonadota bacterium]MCK9242028.1 hypothetical protein [Candidatus Cloacimonadota bacterium]